MTAKRKLVKCETAYDRIRAKYDKDLRVHHATFLMGEDFGFNEMNIQDDLKMKSLFIHHHNANSPNQKNLREYNKKNGHREKNHFEKK